MQGSDVHIFISRSARSRTRALALRESANFCQHRRSHALPYLRSTEDRKGGLSPPLNGARAWLALRRNTAPTSLGRHSSASRCCSADLVESGVGDLVGVNLRRSLDQLRQDSGHIGVGTAVVGFRALFVVPQTDAERILAGWSNKGDFIQKALLLPKHGNDVRFQLLGEFSPAVGLQMQRHSTCIHVAFLGCHGQEGISDNLAQVMVSEDLFSPLTKLGELT